MSIFSTPAMFPRRVWTVTLTDEQVAQAEAVAERIHNKWRKAGVPDGHGAQAGTITTADEVGGHAGELAASILLGVPWTGGMEGETAQGPDVGSRTQVRTLTRPGSHRLLVRPHDLRKYGNVPFVLVQQHADERTYTILGYVMGNEVPFRGRECDGGHRDRPPVWLVHPKALDRPEGLRNP